MPKCDSIKLQSTFGWLLLKIDICVNNVFNNVFINNVFKRFRGFHGFQNC